jgi:hypothetical protein
MNFGNELATENSCLIQTRGIAGERLRLSLVTIQNGLRTDAVAINL